MNQTTPNSKDNVVKWTAATIFVVVLLVASALVYANVRENQKLSEESAAPATDSSLVVSPNGTTGSANDEATGSEVAAPASVKSSTDLKQAEQSLDSLNPDTVTSDLSTNDTDLDSF